MTNVKVDGGIYERQRHCKIHCSLNETSLANIRHNTTQIALTFRDSEETKEGNTISMGSSNVVVYVTDR